eukprot:CAMPEP_0176448160 /NCGR_PEP_ID=MMETSP0127-20121128/25578_1 /TAXON_ID=938130 /ORGANISM="Platyophrya macrostoma, Strain WH" /LENGTH=149 /DNA_ID=CAMNT_0017834977 /DNA_START=155 /DNA_END=604 /DNA_ORIENTATION=-
MTCKEYQVANKRDENDEKFEHFVKGMNFKKCPKCGAWVQKASGCDHISCKCGYAFCYNCGKNKGKENASLDHTCQCLAGALFRPVVMPQANGGILANPPAGLRNQVGNNDNRRGVEKVPDNQQENQNKRLSMGENFDGGDDSDTIPDND